MPAVAVREEPCHCWCKGCVLEWSEAVRIQQKRGRAVPGNAGSYSALQVHPAGGPYAWLSPLASVLSVAWELLHCTIAPSPPRPFCG